MKKIVSITDTSIPNGVAKIIEALPKNQDLQDDDVEIILSFQDSPFIFRTGLVLLTAWRKTLPSHVKVTIDDNGCETAAKRVLDNTGFRDLIEKNIESPRNITYVPGKIPLQPVVRGYTKEQAIGQICEIFENSVSGLDMEAFKQMLSELAVNIFDHSKFETPGYIAAHVLPNINKVEIAIADTGIGILNSYLDGSNEEAKLRLRGGASAIELALDGLMSSKPVQLPGIENTHYGWGLRIVRRLVERNQGRLTVASGKEIVTIDPDHKHNRELARAWDGTFVGILIDLNNPLSLGDVYDEIQNSIMEPPSSKKKSESHKESFFQEKDFVLANYGSMLLTREIGLSIRADLATILSSGVKVKVILNDVEDITPSVADECFGKLAEAMGADKFKQMITFSGGHSLALRLIDLVIKSRLSSKSA